MMKMWLSKNDPSTLKESLFTELFSECRQAAPCARLSFVLRTKLERLDRKERREIVCRTKDGSAPLFIASKKGNVEIVEYLISQCDADIEQRGVYEVPEDRSIHNVTPLWCAAVAGRLAVVKCLVEHGALVNTVSDSGSTPVRSACFMTHLDVVMYLMEHKADILKPNYNGGTCLINSVQSVPLCEFLLQHGATVNARDIQHKTALHYAIQEHRNETTKLLLDNGADPYIKSRCGDDALQTACFKGAKQIFDCLVENVYYDDDRIAEAHELIGSTFLDEHHDLPAALEHWRKALDIRTAKNIPKPQALPPRKAYLDAVEFQTRDELENLALDLDAMRIQSLLICERILGSQHKDMVFRLMYRGAAYADSLQYQRCSDLWLYALHLRMQKDSLMHNETWFTTQALVRLYLDLLEKHNAGILHESVRYEDIVSCIWLLASQFEESMALLRIRPVFKRQQENFDKILKLVTHLFFILVAIPKTEEQVTEMKRLVNFVLRMNPRDSSGNSLLHLVVSRTNTMKQNSVLDDPHVIFPCASVTVLLLECGAHANVTNDHMSTPLHVASQKSNFDPVVVEALLHYGAHIDRRNNANELACALLAIIPECNVKLIQYISLKCLAAREIVKSKINYQGEIPACLEEFILQH